MSVRATTCMIAGILQLMVEAAGELFQKGSIIFHLPFFVYRLLLFTMCHTLSVILHLPFSACSSQFLMHNRIVMRRLFMARLE